ncbi:MAG: hypothetical protein Q4A27_03210 [bacterium]|nr:hypothetical protein [bacterium]
METMKHNNPENTANQWDILTEENSEKARLEAKLAELKNQSAALEAEMKEYLKIMREADSSEMGDAHAYGNLRDRFEYEMQRLSDKSYEIDAEISGLEYRISKLQ